MFKAVDDIKCKPPSLYAIAKFVPFCPSDPSNLNLCFMRFTVESVAPHKSVN